MFYACCRDFSLLPLGLALTACLTGAAQAVPADPDYETISPAQRPPMLTSSFNPPGFATSPLVIADKPVGPHPRMRFVMRDGSVLVGQVLAFDGQMYALRLPHSTVLARKDLFAAIKPAPAGVSQKQTMRSARATRGDAGARY